MDNFLGSALHSRRFDFKMCRKIRFMNTLLTLLLSHFLEECTSGVVNEDTLKEIYSQFFPQGGRYKCEPVNVLQLELCLQS